MISGRFDVRTRECVITIRGLSVDARTQILALGDGRDNVTLGMIQREQRRTT